MRSVRPVVLMCMLLGLLDCSGTNSVPSPPNPLFTGTISFSARGSDDHVHVFVLSDDGTITPLTSGAHDDETPEWSPDGSRLVFQRVDSTGIAVYVMNADGTGLTRLSPTPGSDLLPGFSADGTKVVFSSVVSPNSCNGGSMPTTSILAMSATDGSGRTTLVDGTKASTCFNVEPRASPDGSKVAFMCGPDSGSIQVCVINPDGSGSTFLTRTANTVAGDPHWSWDSRKIAISRRDTTGNVNVWTLSADGSNLTRLTRFSEPTEGGDAGWSLDDSALVFEEGVGGNGQSDPNAPAKISIIGANGEGYASLDVACSGVGCAPRFRPHGRVSERPIGARGAR